MKPQHLLTAAILLCIGFAVGYSVKKGCDHIEVTFSSYPEIFTDPGFKTDMLGTNDWVSITNKSRGVEFITTGRRSECRYCKARKETEEEFFASMRRLEASQQERSSNHIRLMEASTNTILVKDCDITLSELYRIYGTDTNRFIIVTGCRIQGCR